MFTFLSCNRPGINECVRYVRNVTKLFQNCLLDRVLFLQTGDKQDVFYLVRDMVKLVLSLMRDAREVDNFLYNLNLSQLLLVALPVQSSQSSTFILFQLGVCVYVGAGG